MVERLADRKLICEPVSSFRDDLTPLGTWFIYFNEIMNGADEQCSPWVAVGKKKVHRENTYMKNKKEWQDLVFYKDEP